jgi:hypothetical protein
MELTELEAQAVKSIYTDYHAGATNADEALHALEQLINACQHINQRFLDCDDCEVCEMKVCVDCGTEISEED